MNHNIIKKSIFISTIAGALALTGCGGGGGHTFPVSSQITYPSCAPGSSTNISTNSFAGCWLSEFCANNANGFHMRQLEQITETAVVPQFQGAINDYIIEYDNPQCIGKPVAVKHVNNGANNISGTVYTQSYTQIGGTDKSACSETGGTQTLPCTAMDITIKTDHSVVTNLATSFTGETSVMINSGRLCMPTNDYNFWFDNSGSGGIQAQVASPRATVINLLTNHCLTRFNP